MTCSNRLSASRGDFPFDEGKHLTMVLKMWAFGDESGGMDTRYCLVGGFVASERQWKLFRKAWRAALGREKVSAFHAVEFFQPESWESSISPYNGWDFSRAEAFLDSLLDVIKRHPQIYPIGAIVDVADFFAMHPDARRIETGEQRLWRWDLDPGAPEDSMVTVSQRRYRTTGTETRPYPASFFSFVKEALEHTREGTELHIMLDLNSVEEGLARVNYAEIRRQQTLKGWEKLGGILYYESAGAHPPIQLADLYAYVLIDWYTKSGNVGILRKAADVLIGKRKRNIRFRDAAAFEADLQGA